MCVPRSQRSNDLRIKLDAIGSSNASISEIEGRELEQREQHRKDYEAQLRQQTKDLFGHWRELQAYKTGDVFLEELVQLMGDQEEAFGKSAHAEDGDTLRAGIDEVVRASRAIEQLLTSCH